MDLGEIGRCFSLFDEGGESSQADQKLLTTSDAQGEQIINSTSTEPHNISSASTSAVNFFPYVFFYLVFARLSANIYCLYQTLTTTH